MSAPLTGSAGHSQAMASGPLFVVSMWRSGSSLLYALLNKHPQVALMYEADLLLLKPVFLKPAPLSDWAERWEFWNDAFRRHGMKPADVSDGIADFRTAFTAAHQLYARRRGATIWGDKSPNYYDRLNEMADDFPDARFIIVWRDPKGTANSILRAASLGNSYFSRKGAAFCGLLGYEVFKRECDRLLARGKLVWQINYEDLIADTPSVMRRICDFLNIPYDDSLSTLDGADRSAILEGKHHANLRGNQIVRGPRPELIGPEFREKIDRYFGTWRKRYEAEWPAYPQIVATSADSLSPAQRMVDRVKYRLFRLRDTISPFGFSLVPLTLLRRYRARKARRAAKSVSVQPKISPVAVTQHPARGESLS
jgi:hypothetical protein